MLKLKAPEGLRTTINQEIQNAKSQLAKGELKTSWHHLERTHILSQNFAVEHTMAHWLMLSHAIKTQDSKEIVGQIVRLVAGGFLSLIGKIPRGNTGGSNIPATQSMDIPFDLQTILKKYSL